MMSELCAVVPHTSAPAPTGPLALYAARSDLEAAGAQLRADIPEQHLEAVQALVQSIRSADENTLLWQLRSRLALFQLRELLQSIETERMDLTHIAASQSLFAQFLTQAYGDEAKTRSEQVSRLANWFHWSRDATVYQRLIESTEAKLAASAAAAASASASTASSLFSGTALAPARSRRRSRSGATLSITYFYELSPRLPDLRARFTEQPTQLESQVLSYLSMWPLSQLRSTLKQHFGVVSHLPSCQVMEEEEGVETDLPSPRIADAASPMARELQQQQPLMAALADAAVALDYQVPQEAVDHTASTRRDRFAHLTTAAQASPSPLPSSASLSLSVADAEEGEGDEEASDDNDSQQDPLLGSHGAGRTTSRSSRSAAKVESAAAAAAAAAAAQTRPSSAKKRKVESSSAASSRGVVGFESPPADQKLPAVPCMTKPHALPLEIIKLGVKAWLSKRQLPSEPASHRAALDGALVDVMWGFAENDLNDGDRLAIPEFKRARRSAARDVAAQRSSSMSGERACNLLLNVIDMLITRQPQSEL